MSKVSYNGNTYDAEAVVSARQAALIAQVTGHSVGNWIRKNYLPASRPGGPQAPYRILVADLIAYLTKKA